MENDKKIVLVSHRFPLNSTFLQGKFVALSEELPHVYFFAWDTESARLNFASQTGISRKRLLCGATSNPPWGKLLLMIKLIYNFSSSPIKVSIFLWRTARLFGFLDAIKKYALLAPIIKLRPSLIHFEFGTLARDWIFIKDIISCKIVVSFRGYDLNYIGLTSSNYYKTVWEKSDGIHFLGRDLLARAVKRGYDMHVPYALIPPAIDPWFFKPPGKKQRAKGVMQILTVGRLVWKKGYEYALLALHSLKKSGVEFQYIIIGEGPHREALEFYIVELELEDNVELKGNCSPELVRTHMADNDIYLQPSVSEGFCNAVIEAQAMEIPVICTDADGLAENVENGETGIVVPKCDVQAMTNNLLYLYKNPILRQKMGTKGRQRVLRQFVLDHQVNAFIALYENILEL